MRPAPPPTRPPIRLTALGLARSWFSRRALALLALAACGSNPSQHGDDAATGGDAAPDAPVPPGPVTVHVVDKTGAPVANAPVIFIDTDTTTTATTSDASGNASNTISAGASVSVVHVVVEPTPPNITTTTTVMGLVPGDTVTLDVDAFLTHATPLDPTPAGTFTVSYPSYSGAASYSIYDPCGPTIATATSKQLTLQRGCAASTMDLVVIANNGVGAAVAWTQKTGVAFTSGGSATITDAWQPLATVTATYTNATGVGNVELDRYVPTMRGSRASRSGDFSSTTAMIQVTSPHATSAVIQSVVSPCMSTDPTCSDAARQFITDAVDGTASTYALDLGAHLLPWLGYPSFSPATTSLSIDVRGTGTIDLFEADMLYVRNNTDPYMWRVFAPTALTTVQFPTLPASATDATIRPTDKMSTTHAFLCESDALDGYRAAVADVYAAFGTCASSPDPMTKPFGGMHSRLSQSN